MYLYISIYTYACVGIYIIMYLNAHSIRKKRLPCISRDISEWMAPHQSSSPSPQNHVALLCGSVRCPWCRTCTHRHPPQIFMDCANMLSLTRLSWISSLQPAEWCRICDCNLVMAWMVRRLHANRLEVQTRNAIGQPRNVWEIPRLCLSLRLSFDCQVDLYWHASSSFQLFPLRLLRQARGDRAHDKEQFGLIAFHVDLNINGWIECQSLQDTQDSKLNGNPYCVTSQKYESMNKIEWIRYHGYNKCALDSDPPPTFPEARIQLAVCSILIMLSSPLQ